MADMMAIDEGKTRFGRRGPSSYGGAVRCGEVCGGDEKVAAEQSTRLRLAVFDVQRGRGIAAGTTTRSHARAEECVMQSKQRK